MTASRRARTSAHATRLREPRERRREYGDDPLRAYVLAKLGASYLMLGDAAARWRCSTRRTSSRVRWRRRWSRRSPCTGAAPPPWRRGGSTSPAHDVRSASATSPSGSRTARRSRTRAPSSAAFSLFEGNHADAFARLSDAIRVHVRVSATPGGLAIDLDGMASLTMARGHVIDAVRLMGAIDSFRESVAIAMPAPEQFERERMITDAQRELGDPFENLYDGGRLSMDDSVQLAYDSGWAVAGLGHARVSPARSWAWTVASLRRRRADRAGRVGFRASARAARLSVDASRWSDEGAGRSRLLARRVDRATSQQLSRHTASIAKGAAQSELDSRRRRSVSRRFGRRSGVRRRVVRARRPQRAKSLGRTRVRPRRSTVRSLSIAATFSTASRPATGTSSIATVCSACSSTR